MRSQATEVLTRELMSKVKQLNLQDKQVDNLLVKLSIVLDRSDERAASVIKEVLNK